MKLTPTGAVPPVITQAQSSSEQSARSRAISILQGNSQQAQPTQQPTAHAPDLNQNSVTPEMMSAIQPPTPTINEELNQQLNEAPSEQAAIEEAQPQQPLSNQLAMLAKREKALRAKQMQQEAQIKAKEDAIRAKEEALAAKERDYSNGYYSKDLVKQNPLKILADAGVTYDDLTQQILNQSQTNPYTEAQISKLEARINQLAQENEQFKQQSSSQQEQAMQTAMNQIKRDVRQLVAKDPAFETIKATNSMDDVAELIKQTYERDGYVMSVEEAAQEVEEYLLEEAAKLMKLNKIQQRLQPKVQASNAPQVGNNKQSQTPSQPTQTMKTLTNAVSASRPMSARERAILAFKGEKF